MAKGKRRGGKGRGKAKLTCLCGHEVKCIPIEKVDKIVKKMCEVIKEDKKKIIKRTRKQVIKEVHLVWSTIIDDSDDFYDLCTYLNNYLENKLKELEG